MPDAGPFRDLRPHGKEGAFSLPVRKWREILFVGAMREEPGGLFVRDPGRPLPPMQAPGFFAPGVRFRAEPAPDPRSRTPDPLNPRRRDRARIRLTPVDGVGPISEA